MSECFLGHGLYRAIPSTGPAPLSDVTLRLTEAGLAARSISTPSPLAPSTRSSARSPYFVKSKGKLLSTAGNWALAQIRLEHLEAYYRGEMEMFVEGSNTGSKETAVWNVIPKVPSWWPQPPPKED